MNTPLAQAGIVAEPAAAMARSTAGHGRIADIEMLRGIAVIFVLIEHARINLFPWVDIGNSRFYAYFGFWTGVDLFFAISGFVIARSLLPILETKADTKAFFNAAAAFWVRRAWRLLPSAWLWLAIILVAATFFNRTGAFQSFRSNFEGAVAAVLDIANLRLLTVFRRFDVGASFPYWSLSLEEQFYIVLPFLVFVARRRLPAVLMVAIAAQFFITRSGVEASPLGAALNILRNDGLCFGVLIAIWSRHSTYSLFEPIALKQRPLAGLAVLVTLGVLLASVGSQVLHLVSFQMGVVALISAALVYVASYDKDYLFPPGPAKRLLLWVGSRSYGIYLIHIPSYFMTREIWFRLEPPGTAFNGTYTLRYGLTALVLIVTFTELNYRLVELPLRRRGARIADRLSRRVA